MGTKMRKLDVAIVGAGAAGIACGMKLLDKGNHNFMIYEKGRSYEKRYCPVVCYKDYLILIFMGTI